MMVFVVLAKTILTGTRRALIESVLPIYSREEFGGNDMLI